MFSKQQMLTSIFSYPTTCNNKNPNYLCYKQTSNTKKKIKINQTSKFIAKSWSSFFYCAFLSIFKDQQD